MQMESNPHRLVPQGAQIAAALPTYRVPDPVPRTGNRIAELSRKALVWLELRIEQFDLDEAIAAVGVDAQTVTFKDATALCRHCPIHSPARAAPNRPRAE